MRSEGMFATYIYIYMYIYIYIYVQYQFIYRINIVPVCYDYIVPMFPRPPRAKFAELSDVYKGLKTRADEAGERSYTML